MAKCNAHQLEKWDFCSRFQTFCAGEHCRFYEEEKPLTYEDYLHRLSGEELAEFLYTELLDGDGSLDCISKWLKRPYKEREG